VTQHLSLSGAPLLTDSVDAGWRLTLAGHTGQVVERWDGRGSHALTEFDALMRPLSVREKGRGIAEHTLERFTYAGNEADDIAHNLCGQLIRHDDPAGTLRTLDLGMSGALLKNTRQFLLHTDPPDWPARVAEHDALLETGDGALTASQFSPTGELLQQIDALENRQAFAYSVAGELKNSRLTLAGEGQVEQLLVSDNRYNVSGQVDRSHGERSQNRGRRPCPAGFSAAASRSWPDRQLHPDLSSRRWGQSARSGTCRRPGPWADFDPLPLQQPLLARARRAARGCSVGSTPIRRGMSTG
jgi:hypothetical protein